MLCSNWLHLLRLNVPMFFAAKCGYVLRLYVLMCCDYMCLCVAIICAYVLRLYVRYLLRLNVVMCCDYMWLFVVMCVTFVATECL